MKVSVDEGYARWAEGYDAYANPLLTVEEPIVRALLSDTRGVRILDSACGTGRHATWLKERGAIVTACDASKEMLAVAKSKGVDGVHASIDDLPFEDGAFDIVLNALMLEHLENINPAFDEMHRVLAPGGALVISVFHSAFVAKGVPPHFKSNDGNEYEMPGYLHLPSEYIGAMLDLGMRLDVFVEPVVDDAVIARHPNMEKHRGLPLAIILLARRA